MLDLMRRKASSWLIKVLFAVIIVVFCFWGVGSWQENKSNRAAVVNGQMITIEDFRQAYDAQLNRLRQIYGNQMDDKFLKAANLEEQAINQLVERALMLQEAQKMELAVSDRELADRIAAIPWFQRNGRFDNELYMRVLDSNRMTADTFQTVQRQDMVIDRLRSLVVDHVKVADIEISERYQYEQAQVDVDYVFFDPEAFKDITLTDEKVQGFYDKKKEDYKTEPLRQVHYIEFDPDNYAKSVVLNEDQVQEYYDMHTDEFKKEERVTARHILFKLDPDADDETVAAAQKKAEDLLKEIREGKDFAEMAKKHSEGPSGPRGGDLGSFKRKTMVKPFEDAAFALSAGEVSEPVRTRFGWHLIKVEKNEPARTMALDESTKDIRKRLTEQQARTMAYDMAESVFDAFDEQDDLKAFAQKRELTAKTTDPFTSKGPAGMDNGGRFAAEAFQLSKGDLSDIIELGKRYYLMQVIEETPEKISPLADVRAKIEQDLLAELRREKARQAAEVLLKSVRDGKALGEAAAEANVTLANTGFFKRKDSIPEIGFEPTLATAAFTLSEGQALPEEVLSGAKGYYVIQFKARQKPPLDEAFDKRKTQIANTLLNQKQFQAFRNYIDGLRARGEIEIEDRFLTR